MQWNTIASVTLCQEYPYLQLETIASSQLMEGGGGGGGGGYMQRDIQLGIYYKCLVRKQCLTWHFYTIATAVLVHNI